MTIKNVKQTLMSTSFPNIIHTGWGVKRGSTVKNWKRRWFVLLSNGLLRYFTDKLAIEEQGHVIIDAQTNIFTSPAITEGNPVQIVNKKRLFLVTFPTHDEAEKWKDILNALKSDLFSPQQ